MWTWTPSLWTDKADTEWTTTGRGNRYVLPLSEVKARNSPRPSWASWRGHFLFPEEEQRPEAGGSSAAHLEWTGSTPPTERHTESIRCGDTQYNIWNRIRSWGNRVSPCRRLRRRGSSGLALCDTTPTWQFKTCTKKKSWRMNDRCWISEYLWEFMRILSEFLIYYSSF